MTRLERGESRSLFEHRVLEEGGKLHDAWLKAGEDCPACSGTGTVEPTEECPECRGNGVHRYNDWEDGTPNYSDSLNCCHCSGTGRVPRRFLGTEQPLVDVSITNSSSLNNSTWWPKLGFNIKGLPL